MALGAPIGYSTRLTQNNRPDGLYRNQQNNCASQVHIALMGDPTLRMHVVAPPANLTSVIENGATLLNWDVSPDDIIGYYVYRGKSSFGPYTRLTPHPVESNSFQDNNGNFADSYMVRAVKLETSASGTYYNASEGIFLTPTQPATIAATQPSRDTTRVVAKQAPIRTSPASTITPTGSSTNGVLPLPSTGGNHNEVRP